MGITKIEKHMPKNTTSRISHVHHRDRRRRRFVDGLMQFDYVMHTKLYKRDVVIVMHEYSWRTTAAEPRVCLTILASVRMR